MLLFGQHPLQQRTALNISATPQRVKLIQVKQITGLYRTLHLGNPEARHSVTVLLTFSKRIIIGRVDHKRRQLGVADKRGYPFVEGAGAARGGFHGTAAAALAMGWSGCVTIVVTVAVVVFCFVVVVIVGGGEGDEVWEAGVTFVFAKAWEAETKVRALCGEIKKGGG